MIDIRSYRGSDLDPLLTIMNQVVARGDAFVYDEPFDVASMRGWIATYAQVFVAENHGRVVGAYLLRPNFAGRGAHVCNAAYMVDARARGLGVGNRTAEHSLAAAKSLGYSSMQFNAVVSTNATAVALWKRWGFTILGTSPRAGRHNSARLRFDAFKLERRKADQASCARAFTGARALRDFVVHSPPADCRFAICDLISSIANRQS